MENLYSEKIGHRNNFDFLRFALAVSVIFTHGYVIYYGQIDPEPLWKLSRHQLGVGTLALNFFFVISGFLVLQSWTYSKGGLDFLKKRILRIYPGFAVVCLLGALVFAPMGNGTWGNFFPNLKEYWIAVDFHQLAYSVAKLMPPELPETLKKVPCPNDINTSIWTIWYEFMCYLVILGAGLLGLYRRKFFPLVLFLLVYSLNVFHHQAYQHYNQEGIFDWQISFLDETETEQLLNFEHFLNFFLAGACFYYYREYIPRTRSLIVLSLVILAITLRWVRVFELAQVIFGSYLFFCLAFSKKIKLYNFAKYGDFSYGIYLYGWPIQQLVFLYFGSRLNVAGTFFVSLAFVFPFAVFSWHIIEKQFLRLKNFKVNFDFEKYKQRIQPLYDEKAGHKNNFYFLRCLMITAVIFTHSYVIYYLTSTNPDESEPLAALSLGQLTVGSPALNFFFVISGLLISQSWVYSKTWIDFVVRRILRVFPAYIVVSLFCVYVVGPLGLKVLPSFQEITEFWSKTNIASVLSSALTLAYPPVPETFITLPATNIVNASLWSVLYEVFYYMVIIILGLTGVLKKKPIIFFLFLAVFFINILHKNIFEAYNMGRIMITLGFLIFPKPILKICFSLSIIFTTLWQVCFSLHLENTYPAQEN
ncbi:acyltransferase family protein [Spirosoma sp. KNUC1025]|uniref:acyltransferase family protein n=1 Tax=Spirosoma sp. KNUC1025 TaxID=2894082 RepID=UPI00386AA596|nr:acyltransferase family protein [Spirosoma sp. KNUC1025]